MHLPRKWWIGLPVLFGLAYFAQGALTPRLENDLRAGVLSRLAQSPDAIDKAEVGIAGRDVVIAGISLSPDVKARILSALGVDTPARRIIDATQPLSRATPFVLTLERHGAKATMSGNVPPTGARERLRAEIAALGLEVTDNAAYADGAPKSFADLASFAVRRLAELDPATTTLTDATLSVSGEARSAADYDKAVAALKAPPFGESAIKSQVSPPRVSPYVFSATLRNGIISLSGHLPSDDMRKQVVAMAAAAGAGAAVSDSAQLGAGAPAGDFAGALAFAVGELGKLSQGKVAVSDGKIYVEGQGRENVLSATIEADAKARLPSGFEIARLDVMAGPISPYVFKAERAGGEVTLTGYAPDDAVRNRIVETARRNFFDATVVDRLVVAKGAPQNFAEAMDRSLAALARLDEGKLAISDSNISLAGSARHQSARADIAAFADALPQSFRGEAQISTRIIGSPLDAGQCGAALSGLLAKSPMVFASDDSTIAAESAPLIDAIAATALRCQGATLEIAAHTDNVGIAEMNLGRSKRRAQAVLEQFVKAGIDPFKITAVGYGGERPIVPNDNDENRARNRRVEIFVK